MASLDFPANPVDQQQYSINGIVYYYNAAIGAWLTVLSSRVTDTSSNTQILFNDAGVSNGTYGLAFNKWSNTAYINALIINGNLGVGNTNPNLKVEVAGELSVQNFIEFSSNINYNYTITTGRNALSAGPVSIANGYTVTIPSGSYWSVT